VSEFEPIGDIRVLALQLQARRIGLELQKCREIVIAASASDEGLNQLMDKRGDGKRDLLLAGGGKSEIEILTEQGGCERGLEIEVNKRRRLVAGELRAHDALVEAGKERFPASTVTSAIAWVTTPRNRL
jgi:hypothetical protein